MSGFYTKLKVDVNIKSSDVIEELEYKNIEFNDELIDKVMCEIKWCLEDEPKVITDFIIEYFGKSTIDDWFEQIKEDEEVG